MQDIFERGIDPNVDDPSECHVGGYRCTKYLALMPGNSPTRKFLRKTKTGRRS